MCGRRIADAGSKDPLAREEMVRELAASESLTCSPVELPGGDLVESLLRGEAVIVCVAHLREADYAAFVEHEG